jgi:hydroxyacid-oxoacid transhydrogenase
VKSYRAPGYVTDHAIVPHGMSVILNAPAVYRYTPGATPARQLKASEALGANVTGARADDAGKILADRITWFMQRLQMLSPRAAGAEELGALFEDSMVAW